METTKIESTAKDIRIFCDYQKFLRKLWSDCKVRDWKVYSQDIARQFWDERYSVDVEVRQR